MTDDLLSFKSLSTAFTKYYTKNAPVGEWEWGIFSDAAESRTMESWLTGVFKELFPPLDFDTLHISYTAAHQESKLEEHYWAEFMAITDQR